MEINSKVRNISLTLLRLKQILIYIRTFWPANSINRNSENEQLTKNYCKQCKMKGLQYWIMNNKMYLASDYIESANDQTIKLKNVDTLLQFVDTNLQQVTKGIETIYQHVLLYQDVVCTTHQPKQVMTSQQTSNDYQKKQDNGRIFNHIFKFINNSLFHCTFGEILSKSPKKLAILFLQIQTKLSVLPSMIQSASKFQSDITTSAPFVQKYSHAWNNIRFIDMRDLSQTITEQISRLKTMMKITTSAVVNQKTSLQLQLVRKVIFGLSFPYFWLADEESQLRCYKIWRNPKVQNLNSVWNLPENGAIKHCKKIVFPSIKTSFFIYIPSNYLETKERCKDSKIKQQLPQIFIEPEAANQFIRVSVLYYGKLKFVSQFQRHEPFSFFPCMDIAEEGQLDTIIIHFHGGGFVALSSQTSQSYTRKWANELKVPVFSVDYRKPPQFRFPIPLQDCLTAYQFIIENIHRYLKIRPKNIILAGDSAGGNLAVSLQALLMQKKYPIQPSGLFLAYPAVDLRVKYSPSRLNSFDDPILIPPLLFLCLRQYLGPDNSKQQHPLASPILLSQYFIRTGQIPREPLKEQEKKWPKMWPKTTIMVGKKDPLYDDSLRLLERMSNSGVNVKLIIYNQFSHAFLSLDNMIPLCSRTIDDAVTELQKLIYF